jgi:hypothetical protein
VLVGRGFHGNHSNKVHTTTCQLENAGSSVVRSLTCFRA